MISSSVAAVRWPPFALSSASGTMSLHATEQPTACTPLSVRLERDQPFFFSSPKFVLAMPPQLWSAAMSSCSTVGGCASHDTPGGDCSCMP